MMRRFVFGVVVAVLAVSMAGGSFPSHEFDITFMAGRGKKVYLTIKKGKLTVGPSSDIWYIDGSRLKWGRGRYLGYDLSGKDKRVFVVAKPGKNTQWNVSNTTIGTRDEPKGYTSHFTAANGKLAGKDLRLGVLKPARKGARTVYQPVVSSDDELPLATAWRVIEHK